MAEKRSPRSRIHQEWRRGDSTKQTTGSSLNVPARDPVEHGTSGMRRRIQLMQQSIIVTAISDALRHLFPMRAVGAAQSFPGCRQGRFDLVPVAVRTLLMCDTKNGIQQDFVAVR
ncbi:hypothetical protein GCM10027431_10050 [Lysobacter rhizosphaerae]